MEWELDVYRFYSQLLKLTFYQTIEDKNLESELSLWKDWLWFLSENRFLENAHLKHWLYSNTTHLLHIKNKQIRSKSLFFQLNSVLQGQ